MKTFKRLLVAMIAAVMAVSVGVLAACTEKEPERVPVDTFEIDKTTLAIDNGATGELTIVMNFDATNKGVEWKSEDATVATVAAKEGNEQVGVVTGVKPGKTTVTATSKDNADKKVTCEVTVKTAKLATLNGTNGNRYVDPDGNEQEVEFVFYADGTLDGTRKVSIFTGEYKEGTYKAEGDSISIDCTFVTDLSALGAGVIEVEHKLSLEEGTGAVAGEYVFADKEQENGNWVPKGYMTISVDQLKALGVTKPALTPAVKITSLTANTGYESKEINLKSGDFLIFGDLIKANTYVKVEPANATFTNIKTSVDEKDNATGILRDLSLLNMVQALKPGEVKVTFKTMDGTKKEVVMTVKVTDPDKLAALGTTYFAEDTAFNSTAENSKITYTLKADGTLEIKDDQDVTGYGYYSLVKEGETVTKIQLQRFGTDKTAVAEYAVTTDAAGKLSFDIGLLEPNVMKQVEKVYDKASNITETYFDTEKTFEGDVQIDFGMGFMPLGGSRKYVFKADGTLEVYKDEALEQTGYYCIEKDGSTVTKIILQRFGDDKDKANEYTVTDKDGKMAVELGDGTTVKLEIVEK